jgi:hypothetical protein
MTLGLKVVRWALLASLVGTFLAAQAGAFSGWDRPLPYKTLSADHVGYGVSQLLAGNISQTNSYPLRLWNPGPVDMVACIFMYERLQLDCSHSGSSSNPCTQDDIEEGDGIAEALVGTVCIDLTPHASIGLEEDFFDYPELEDDEDRRYVEVLSVPKQRLTGRVFGRVADGLGLRGNKGTDGYTMHPVHPSLWSLPEDSNQRNLAINRMCEKAIEHGELLLWIDFNVNCSGGPLPVE